MTNVLSKTKRNMGAYLYYMKQSDEDRRFKQVKDEYEAYLNEWRGKVVEACKLSGVKKQRTPDWLPYYVKHTKDAD